VQADDSTVTDVEGSGYNANVGSVMKASNATATNAMWGGFNGYGASYVEANGSDTIGTRAGAGFQIGNNSALEAFDATSTDDANGGFHASIGSSMNIDRAHVTAPGGSAFSANTGAVIMANDAVAEGSGNGAAFDAFLHSVIQANNGVATGTVNSPAYSANLGSTLFVNGARAEDTQGNSFQAFLGSTIQADNAISKNASGEAFHANMGSAMRVTQATSDGNTGAAFRVQNGSTMDANGGVSDNSEWACFAADGGAWLEASNARANGCAADGFTAGTGSLMQVTEAIATDVGGTGFNAWGGSGINGPRARVEGATNGIMASQNAWGWIQDAYVSDCTGSGIVANQGSYLDVSSSDIANDVRSRIEDVDGWGLQSHQRSFVIAYGMEILRAGWSGAQVGQLSGLQIDQGRIIGSRDGEGASSGDQSYLSAWRTVVEDNTRGGVSCQSSFCNLQEAVVRNNGTNTFGLNAFWNAWMMTGGATVTGHSNPLGQLMNFNLPRTNDPTIEAQMYGTEALLP